MFDKREIDFGCILNDTEVMRPGRMTNNSPLPVRYAWFFIRRPPVVRQDPELLDEGVDMESDHETTEEEEITEITEEEDSGEEERDSQGSSKEELASVGSGFEEKEGGEGKGKGGEKTVEGEVRMEEEKGKEVEEEQREGNGKWEEDGSERKEVKVSKKKGGKRRKGGKGEVEKKQDEARKEEEEGKGTVDEKINEQMKGRKGSDVTDADLAAMSNQVSVVISGEGDDIIEVIGPHFPVPKKSDFSSKGGDGEDDGHDIHVKINSKAALIGGDEVGSEHGSHQHGKLSSTGIPTSDAQTQLSGGSDSSSSNKRKRKKKRKKAPWELAFDPFKPIPISQVSTHSVPTAHILPSPPFSFLSPCPSLLSPPSILSISTASFSHLPTPCPSLLFPPNLSTSTPSFSPLPTPSTLHLPLPPPPPFPPGLRYSSHTWSPGAWSLVLYPLQLLRPL